MCLPENNVTIEKTLSDRAIVQIFERTNMRYDSGATIDFSIFPGRVSDAAVAAIYPINVRIKSFHPCARKRVRDPAAAVR
jgi:hypothetical protein